MPTIYEQIRHLMAEAESRHAAIDREFEGKLQSLIGHDKEDQLPALDREKATEQLEPLPTFPGIHGGAVARAVTVPETENGRARKGAVQNAVRQLLSDGDEHKLVDIARILGRSRNAAFAALKRMTYEGEVEALGNGMYRGTPKLIEVATGQEALRTFH